MIGLAALGLGAGGGIAVAEEDSPEPELVFHVDMAEPQRISSTIFNASSAASHYEAQLLDYEVRLVLQGYGLQYVTEERLEGSAYEVPEAKVEQRDQLLARLRSLASTYDGVQLEVCESSMEEAGLAASDLAVEAELVPYGATRIEELQRQGFSYIKMQ
ncbi:MAG: DsrE family protein [Halorhodospira sp.]